MKKTIRVAEICLAKTKKNAPSIPNVYVNDNDNDNGNVDVNVNENDNDNAAAVAAYNSADGNLPSASVAAAANLKNLSNTERKFN